MGCSGGCSGTKPRPHAQGGVLPSSTAVAEVHVPDVLGADAHGLPRAPGYKPPPAHERPLGVADGLLGVPGTVNVAAMAEAGPPVPLREFGEGEKDGGSASLPHNEPCCCCCCRSSDKKCGTGNGHGDPPEPTQSIPTATLTAPEPSASVPASPGWPLQTPGVQSSPPTTHNVTDFTVPDLTRPPGFNAPPAQLQVLGAADAVSDVPGMVNVTAMAGPGKPVPSVCCDDCASEERDSCGEDAPDRDGCCRCCCRERAETDVGEPVDDADTDGSKPPFAARASDGERFGPRPAANLTENGIAGEIPPDSRTPQGAPSVNAMTLAGMQAGCWFGATWAPGIGHLNGTLVDGCIPLPCPLPKGFSYVPKYAHLECGPPIPDDWNPTTFSRPLPSSPSPQDAAAAESTHRTHWPVFPPGPVDVGGLPDLGSGPSGGILACATDGELDANFQRDPTGTNHEYAWLNLSPSWVVPEKLQVDLRNVVAPARASSWKSKSPDSSWSSVVPSSSQADYFLNAKKAAETAMGRMGVGNALGFHKLHGFKDSMDPFIHAFNWYLSNTGIHREFSLSSAARSSPRLADAIECVVQYAVLRAAKEIDQRADESSFEMKSHRLYSFTEQERDRVWYWVLGGFTLGFRALVKPGYDFPKNAMEWTFFPAQRDSMRVAVWAVDRFDMNATNVAVEPSILFANLTYS